MARVGPRRFVAGLDRRPLLLSTVALLVATVTAAVMAGYAGFPRVVHLVHNFRPEWIAVIAGGRALCHIGYTLAYRVTMRLRRGPRLSLWQSLGLVSAGFGVFVVGGGFAVDRRALRGLGASREQARVRVLGLGALEYTALAPVAWACALYLLGAPGVKSGLTLPWVVGVPAGAVIALWISFRRHRTPVGAWLKRLAQPGVVALQMVREVASPRRGHQTAWLGIFLYWVGELLSAWAALRLFGLHLSLPRLVLAYATGYAITPRGLPLAGVGVTEVLMPLAYTWVGLPLAPAVLAVFAYRLVTLVLALPPALIAHARVERMRVDPWGADDEPPGAGERNPPARLVDAGASAGSRAEGNAASGARRLGLRPARGATGH
jgi:uncharacterized membrane protein YbhN (UPF0104 family)